MRLHLLLAAAAATLGLGSTGCVLNLGDDDVICPKTGVAAAPINSFLLDPEDLVCKEVDFPIGGCGGAPPSEFPTWAACQSQCTGLTSQSCMATSGCRVAWDHTCLLTDAICTLPDNGYLGCFAVDTTGPIQGACEGLAAQDCSRHDDCLATYQRDERCGDQADNDFDGSIDEPDECLGFGLCMDEMR